MDISNNDTTSSPVAPGARRKSGRAVRVPEKFIPEVASSQPGATKRKRSEENVEENASDVEELDESEEEEGGGGEDDDRVKESRRKSKAKTAKKPAAKKPKTNGTLSHEAAPAVQLPQRPKKAKRTVLEDEGAEGLYGTPMFLSMILQMLTC